MPSLRFSRPQKKAKQISQSLSLNSQPLIISFSLSLTRHRFERQPGGDHQRPGARRRPDRRRHRKLEKHVVSRREEDPVMIRDRVERKTRKKVELLSSRPKDTEMKKDKDNPKEPQASTVVLKIQLHCDGCTQRIHKRILGIKGVATVSMGRAKDLVTVKGIMDPKALPGVLMEKLKKPIEVVPPKKDNAGDKEKLKKAVEKKDNAGDKTERLKKPVKKDNAGDKKEKDGMGGEKKKNGGSSSKQKGGDAEAAAAAGSEGNKIEYYSSEYGKTPYYVHAPQYFSDENPNAM